MVSLIGLVVVVGAGIAYVALRMRKDRIEERERRAQAARTSAAERAYVREMERLGIKVRR